MAGQVYRLNIERYRAKGEAIQPAQAIDGVDAFSKLLVSDETNVKFTAQASSETPVDVHSAVVPSILKHHID